MKSVAETAQQSPPVYLLAGDDEYRRNTRATQVVEALCPPDQQSFGLEIIDGDVGNTEDALKAIAACNAALRTPGFLGGRKLVWLRDASFLASSPRVSGEEVRARLAGLAELIRDGLPPGVTMLVSAPSIDKRGSFYKACSAVGSVELFEKPSKAYQLTRYVTDIAADAFRKEKINIAPDLLQLFLQRTGNDTRQIVQEVEKLSIYLGERRRIRREDIIAVVAPVREAAHWEFADAVINRDTLTALRILRNLLAHREQPIGLIVSLERRFRELLILRDCLDRGWLRIITLGRRKDAKWLDSPEVDESLSGLPSDPRRDHPYRTAMRAREAARYTIAELLAARRLVVDAHLQMLSTSLPPAMLLEFLVLQINARLPDRRSGASAPK